jgi:hypothetical protein
MNKLILTIFLILIFAYPVYAYEFGEHWTPKDSIYQTATISLLAIDWAQTHSMVKSDYYWGGKQYQEMNPILGKRPKTDTVDEYFPACILAHTLIALALPDKAKIFGYEINPRRIWQGTFIVVESGTTINNAIGGVRIEF